MFGKTVLLYEYESRELAGLLVKGRKAVIQFPEGTEICNSPPRSKGFCVPIIFFTSTGISFHWTTVAWE
jgi:hypothetical protein